MEDRILVLVLIRFQPDCHQMRDNIPDGPQEPALRVLYKSSIYSVRLPILGICRGCLRKRHKTRKILYEARIKPTFLPQDDFGLDSTPHVYMTMCVSYISSPLSCCDRSTRRNPTKRRWYRISGQLSNSRHEYADRFDTGKYISGGHR